MKKPLKHEQHITWPLHNWAKLIEEILAVEGDQSRLSFWYPPGDITNPRSTAKTIRPRNSNLPQLDPPPAALVGSRRRGRAQSKTNVLAGSSPCADGTTPEWRRRSHRSSPQLNFWEDMQYCWINWIEMAHVYLQHRSPAVPESWNSSPIATFPCLAILGVWLAAFAFASIYIFFVSSILLLPSCNPRFDSKPSSEKRSCCRSSVRARGFQHVMKYQPYQQLCIDLGPRCLSFSSWVRRSTVEKIDLQ